MVQYIDKAVIKAELERIEHETNYEPFTDEVLGKRFACRSLLSFLNTIEVKEVDIEKELDEWIKYGPHTNYPWCTIPDAIKITAEHFFELGLKARKEE